MKIEIQLLTTTAQLPRYAHEGDSGLDLRADIPAPVTIHPGDRAAIPTGIAVAIPPGHEGQVRPRSGLARSLGVFAHVGTIDSGYRGEVGVTLQHLGDGPFVVHPGDRIAQLVIAPVYRVELVEVQALPPVTARGVNGFGSSGIQ